LFEGCKQKRPICVSIIVILFTTTIIDYHFFCSPTIFTKIYHDVRSCLYVHVGLFQNFLELLKMILFVCFNAPLS
uniref:Uncharacterized protein n=1 Tax=Aegilops tauschii subsp. strangulata TaxID=200361 RepID=A0A453HHA1_AEGTS